MDAGRNTADPAGEAKWRALVEKGLRGQPFSSLVAASAEGFPIQPLQPATKPVAAGGRPAEPWMRLQRIDHPDSDQAGALALEALNGGADGLALVFAGAPGARGFGLPAGQLAIALESVLIDACPIRLETGADGIAIAERLAAETKRRRIDPALVRFSFGVDPISAMAASGSGAAAWPRTREAVAGLVSRLAASGYRGPLLAADGRRIHEAGADAASELAYVLAATVAYLRALAEAGLSAETLSGAIEAVLAADSDQFMTIAKFRAVRLLLRRVRTASGLSPDPIRVHAETSYRMTTRLDAHSNLIRAAIAAFSAGVGGADSLSVLPYTAPFGLTASAPRRLALDTQSVLIEEVNAYRVADPASGSGAVEALTADLAAEAWRRFQAIEAEGGLPAALASGALQKRITAERAKRMEGVASGEIAIIGVNLFGAAGAQAADVERPSPVAELSARTQFEPLPSVRTSETAEGAAA